MTASSSTSSDTADTSSNINNASVTVKEELHS